MNTLKKLIFAAESVAHLQGYEREILPLTDKVREMEEAIKAHLNPFVDRQTAHDLLMKAIGLE
jgi:hypothetical protein